MSIYFPTILAMTFNCLLFWFSEIEQNRLVGTSGDGYCVRFTPDNWTLIIAFGLVIPSLLRLLFYCKISSLNQWTRNKMLTTDKN